LDGFISHVISVDNLPSLGCLSILSISNDVGSFDIFTTININNFAVSNVGEVGSVEFEDLPPS
jgi:hypothetical protein